MDNSNMCMHCLIIPTGDQKLQTCRRCKVHHISTIITTICYYYYYYYYYHKNARYCSRDCQTQVLNIISLYH